MLNKKSTLRCLNGSIALEAVGCIHQVLIENTESVGNAVDVIKRTVPGVREVTVMPIVITVDTSEGPLTVKFNGSQFDIME